MLKKLFFVALPLASILMAMGCDQPDSTPPSNKTDLEKPADPEKNKAGELPNSAGPEMPPPPV